MKLKRFFLILFYVSLIINANAQTDLESIPFTKYIVKENNTDYFLISTKPVTNREYITYLLWVYFIYPDYPENYVSEIPGLNQVLYSNLLSDYGGAMPNPFEIIIKYGEPFVKQYMFNPKFIDYPVIGVSWLQANHYCKWLSDRYNEYKLVNNGYLKLDLNQQNSNCFTSESYLANQYEGYPIKPERVTWKNSLFIPAFHVPTEKEMNIATKEKSFQKEIKSYKSDTRTFLDLWQKWYFLAKDSSLILSPDSLIFLPFTIKCPEEKWDINKYKYEELKYDMDRSNPSFKDIFDKKNQYKINPNDTSAFINEFGEMPYMIIDEDANKEPVIVEKYSNHEFVKLDSAKYYYFRFSGIMRPKQ